MSFDAYHKWLGIPPEEQPPHYYQLLGISVKERDPEVIETAAQRQRSILEENLHGPHRKAASQLIFEVEEAELTLLSPELREEYDRQVRLVLKKQKRKQSGHNLDPDSNRPAGEGSGLLYRFVGIMSVILAGYLIMAYFEYQKPRTEEEKKKLRAQPISVKKQTIPTKPAAEKTEPSKPTPVPLAKTEAEAAAWIFSVGGKIRIKSGNGSESIERDTDLPPSPFEVIIIDLNKCDVNDETLANILPLTSVRSLLLNSTKIADNSFKVINQLKNLQHLYVAGTNVTGQGIAQLSDQLNLKALYVNNNRGIDDESIKYVVQYPQLTGVSLAETDITGRSLATLTSLKNLIRIQIHLTEIEDQSLDQLQAFPELQELLLGGPLNSEQAILNALQYLKKLKVLWIVDVPLSDAGINRLANMTTLKEIRLVRTKVTDANVNRLKQALPGAEITVEK
ncbi:Leucine Rich repeats (2 copies) [Gimesia alba]|uniref:Leucine Rich repeats (2 copies) n=1 Tax=Gimesia alba TaxID=2527973 RepID=A0A517R8R3_9PLAN|nr:hypothetical protein [Gimesia alba]QDT40241.1 Leucine Rich repeats (2 copies) [Gimesia alba]